ncbi:carbohydrate ABC transporter permease [Pseudolysinimonas kribbensis]|uniref:ABC transporter permease n=1 Tax=Pseudolysinimonas kribbensis TaxID=433641 RepID=A0ABQ6KC00_9MICO|nr:carbohydrate ABC transporter permease [Pseudolysinimonas kribbensis]GMA96051.1 ABC transporter permease [Pseudolysinimonas kribbensis]
MLHRRRWVLTIIGVVLVAIYIFPLYWMVTTSIKPQSQLFTSPPTWFPTSFDFGNYVTAVFGNAQMLRALSNSFIVSIGTTLVTLVIAAPAAYGFARLKLRWTSLLLLPFLLAQLLPTINLALPMFALFAQAGLTNSPWGLILGDTVIALPFAVIVLRPFYLGIPRELEEAAEVDGCNRWQAFWRIVLPVVRPGLVTVMAFTFVMTWGEFTLGITLNPRQEAQPVTVALNSFIGQYGTQWGPLMAASTVVAIPIVVLFIVFQRFITAGLAAGSVKD